MLCWLATLWTWLYVASPPHKAPSLKSSLARHAAAKTTYVDSSERADKPKRQATHNPSSAILHCGAINTTVAHTMSGFHGQAKASR